MDKLLELCFRSIVRNINQDHQVANVYKSQALKIHKKIEFEDRCIYPVGITVPKETKIKLYEMVS